MITKIMLWVWTIIIIAYNILSKFSSFELDYELENNILRFMIVFLFIALVVDFRKHDGILASDTESEV